MSWLGAASREVPGDREGFESNKTSSCAIRRSLCRLLAHRLGLPEIPCAALVASRLVAKGAFLGRDVRDGAAQAERDCLQPCIDFRVDGTDDRTLDCRAHHDIPMTAHQSHRFVSEGFGK